jgi:photosystem II stability/assembly factor-like uncharacterized protein
MNVRRLILIAAGLQSSAAGAMTVDEIVTRYIDARGGMAHLKAIHSLRTTGSAIFGGGHGTIEAESAEVIKRPGMVRDEVTIQGLTQVDAYDGHDAWVMDPFGGRREPRRSTADEAKGRAEDADIDGPLVDWREKGHRVEYLGTEDVDGTAAIKLRVNLKDGDVLYVYLDPDYFLEIREVSERHIRGTERITEQDLGGYAQVAGVWMPMTTDGGPKGGPRDFHFRISRVEVNVDVDDALFHFPREGEPVKRAILPGPPGTGGSTASHPHVKRVVPTLDSGVLSGLGARNIGSAEMSGRIAAVTGRNVDGKTTLFVGAASGGVWRSFDGGTTFKPVFDKQSVQSIGAIAIDPTNSKTIWVGTGESWTRNSASIGDGVYKSTDGGETWTNMGLRESERITRVIVDPRNGDVVYVCAPGKLWSDSPDRGLYKTADGGKTWKLVLAGRNLSTGCSSVAMDPKNADVLFAGLWDFRRKGWSFRSGGDGPDAPSGSALFRSADAGRTWTELTPQTNAGIPNKPWGRVEVVTAPSNDKVVYALIESKDSALYRSSDGGNTWEGRDKSQGMVWRPFYFGRLVVDPTNADRLFKPGGGLIVSDDGGRSFTYAGGGSHGDWHDLWIDPDNSKHIVGGDDGGLWLSWDGGNRWWKNGNLPVSQFYHVTVDDKDPYQVYGGLQDNGTFVGDSEYPGGISNERWESLYDSDGFWAVLDPSDPEAVYVEGQGGYVARVDRRTHVARDVQPKAGYQEKLRFNWNTPIAASPTDKKTIYIGSQFLFRSRDRGDTWERISPDLTTNDPEKQKQEQSGGVTVDNSSAETHTTIYSICESPLDSKTIWVGTDDGNLQLTRDAGKHWTNVVANVNGLPKASWVSWVEASRFELGTAYAAFDRHSYGDMSPWVYRTSDFGKSWSRIVGPWKGVRGYAHVIKEDTVKPALLFLGTEFGLWISVDAGRTWAQFKGGDFPEVAVRDLQVHPRTHDLVIGTHGRGIWIVDDITPLRSLSSDVLEREAAFLPGSPIQERMPEEGGWVQGDATFVGQNPPGGAVITYYQRSRHLFGPIKLEIFDSDGKLVDTVPPSIRKGLNRVSWTMQAKPPRVPRAATVAFGASRGPTVLPGTYTVRLTKGADVVESKIEVNLDRRAPFTVADRKAQFDAAMRVHALFGQMSDLVDKLEATASAARNHSKTLPASDDLGKRLARLAEDVDEVRKKIVATKEGGAITGEERIREHADILYRALISWEGRPAAYQMERIDALTRELDDVTKEFASIVSRQIHPLNEELKGRRMAPIPGE